MCGIVGGIAERNVSPILMEGLRRLEYRGYDSSGMALLDDVNALHRVRSLGKIQQLQNKVDQLNAPFTGRIGIAHTRWATHGIPSENKILNNGDILNVDVTVILDGWHGDSSRMFVAGKTNKKNFNLHIPKLIKKYYLFKFL